MGLRILKTDKIFNKEKAICICKKKKLIHAQVSGSHFIFAILYFIFELFLDSLWEI